MRKRKAFDKRPVAPHEAAEHVIEASSQPVSTEAPDQMPDRTLESSQLERTMKDYYDRSDDESQGAVPIEPPDHNPLPLQHAEKPKRPPTHNM
jgi:hypothetical protein